MGGETAFDLQQQYNTAAWYEQPRVYEPLRKRLKAIPADAPEQIAALKAERDMLEDEMKRYRSVATDPSAALGDCPDAPGYPRGICIGCGRRKVCDLIHAAEEIAALRAELAEITENTKRAIQGECGHLDEVHCSCRPILLRAIEGLKAKIAELKGMTAYARTSEAAKQSVEYWREMATLAEEEEKITKAELGETRERREETIAMCEQLQGELARAREERENWRNAFCHAREQAEGLTRALEGLRNEAHRIAIAPNVGTPGGSAASYQRGESETARVLCRMAEKALAAYRESRKGDRS